MAKFKRGDKVRVKDNPTMANGCGASFNPGDIVMVWDSAPDYEGDITVYPEYSGDCNWEYIHEDCVELVETDPQDVRVGDRVRAYNKLTEITIEGVVREIEEKDNHKWVWVGKSYDIAADLNTPEGYDISVLERAFKWPDHEGFVRITGGKFKDSRALAYQNADGGFSIRQDWGGYLTSDYTSKVDPEFNFEYVEG